MRSSDLAVVSTFRLAADAQLAKGILDAAGIESMVRADNAGGMYPAPHGIRRSLMQKRCVRLRRYRSLPMAIGDAMKD